MSSEYRKVIQSTNYNSHRLGNINEQADLNSSSSRQYSIVYFRENSRTYISPNSNIKMASSKKVSDQYESNQGDSRYTVSQRRM